MPPVRPSFRGGQQVNSWRSGLEEAIGAQLADSGIPVRFEELVIPFEQPSKGRTYRPDFLLPNGIIIESKGRFVTADRQKHLLVMSQHPDLDIRFVFSRGATRISKTSRTTYALWAESKGFRWAERTIPAAWLAEPKNVRSLRAISRLLQSGKRTRS